MSVAGIVVYGLAWLAFGTLHSILASARVKGHLDGVLGAGYRLAYNGFAILSLIAVLAVGHAVLGGTARFDHPAGLKIILSGMEVAGWIIMLIALGGYDLGRFAGWSQVRAKRDGAVHDEDEPLRTRGLHRYVRHPLYSGAFLALWGAAWTPLGLATAAFGTVYLVIGTWFEERRLMARYRDAYADYRSRVPAFVPWRGRAV